MATIDIISQYGFPIAITLYLLWERHTLLKYFGELIKENTKAITELRLLIVKIK